jgi:epoxyqueuosine reductase
MSEAEYERWFNGSPVRRTKFRGFRRNLAIAMGNSGQREFLSRLQEWASDPDSVLAEAAGWATSRLLREEAGKKKISG